MQSDLLLVTVALWGLSLIHIWYIRWHRFHMLPRERADQLRSQATDVILDDPDLRGIDVHDVAGKGRLRTCGLENVLHVAEQLVDVLTRDSQPGLLRLIQLSGVPRHSSLWVPFGHESSSASSLRISRMAHAFPARRPFKASGSPRCFCARGTPRHTTANALITQFVWESWRAHNFPTGFPVRSHQLPVRIVNLWLGSG